MIVKNLFYRCQKIINVYLFKDYYLFILNGFINKLPKDAMFK